jgi:hypothetical protein
MEFQSHAELALHASQNNWSQEQVDEANAALNLKFQTNNGDSGGDSGQGGNGDQGGDNGGGSGDNGGGASGDNGGGNQRATEIQITDEVEEAIAKKYGIERTALGNLPSFMEKAEKFDKLSHKAEVLSKIDNPFASPEDAFINTIKKDLGIRDNAAANFIASIDGEKSNQVDIIIASKLLESPDVAMKMGFDKFRLAIESEIGVAADDFEDLNDDSLKAKVELMAATSLKTIEQKKSEASEKTNSILSLFQDPASESKASARLEEWKKEAPSLVSRFSKIETEVKYGDTPIKVSLALQPEHVEAVISQILPGLGGTDVSDDAKAELSSTVDQLLRLATMNQTIAACIDEWKKTEVARLEDEIRQEYESGGGVKRSSGQGGEGPKKSPAEIEAEKRFARTQ